MRADSRFPEEMSFRIRTLRAAASVASQTDRGRGGRGFGGGEEIDSSSSTSIPSEFSTTIWGTEDDEDAASDDPDRISC